MSFSITKFKNSYLSKAKAAIFQGYLSYRNIANRIALNHFPSQTNLISGEAPPAFTVLRKKIDRIKRYIDRDYCILDVPNYRNIGDHLIHAGNLDFLKTLSFTNTYEASLHSFKKKYIDSKDLIILQGGGNFGDLYPPHQQFREEIVSSYRKNKIIIFPQTIYFRNEQNLKRAVKKFSAHQNLIICVRDKLSYEFALNNFTKNKILLLPDMASYTQLGVKKRAAKSPRNTLYLKRKDDELKESYAALPYFKNLDVKDWPTFEYNFYEYLTEKHKQHRFYINEGMLFLSQYDLIISSRLHGCILAALLGVPTILLNNSYFKNRMYYKTWLTEMPDCYFAHNKKELECLIEKHSSELIK